MANVELILKPRNCGISHLAKWMREHDVSRLPPAWFADLHRKAVEAHRTIDMQLMLATGDDLEARKERRWLYSD
jgi:hypothetical protein